MASDKTQIRLAMIGLAISVLTAATTLGIKLIDIAYPDDQTVATATNAAGTNTVGTNAAADPKMAVPGNAGHIEYKEAPPNTIAFPLWAVVLILCGLVAVASMLYTKRAMSRMKKKASELA